MREPRLSEAMDVVADTIFHNLVHTNPDPTKRVHCHHVAGDYEIHVHDNEGEHTHEWVPREGATT